MILSFWFLESCRPIIVMIAHQTSIWSLSFFSKFQPFVAFFQNFVFFQVKMSSDNSLETFRRIFNIFQHCKFDITISNNIRVRLILFLSFNCTLLMFKPRLIEIYLFSHDDRLYRNQNLQKSWNFRIPILHSWASPSS